MARARRRRDTNTVGARRRANRAARGRRANQAATPAATPRRANRAGRRVNRAAITGDQPTTLKFRGTRTKGTYNATKGGFRAAGKKETY